MLCIVSALGFKANAQGTWTAPAVPGVNPLSLGSSDEVYLYNIDADAFVTYGMNWNTQAVTTRLKAGDETESGRHKMKVAVQGGGTTIKMSMKDKSDKTIFCGGGTTTDIWTDNTNNNVWTPAASANYTNAYTLNNTHHKKDLDVQWLYGGRLTFDGGQGFKDWAFIPAASITDGSYAKYKERRDMYAIYKELNDNGKVSTYSEALATANDTYTNPDATKDELRAATRALLIAVAEGIENPVRANALFTNSDIHGNKVSTDWGVNLSTTGGNPQMGDYTCELWHATATIKQTKTDVPNGLYDVIFHGLYRQDDSKTQAAPHLTVTGTNVLEDDLNLINNLSSKWAVSNNGGWVGTGVPNDRVTAGEGQTLGDAVAAINNVQVKGNSLDIQLAITGGNQWVLFQGFDIIYNGPINLALYKKILEVVETANGLKSSPMNASVKTALTDAIDATAGLSANSDEDELNDALSALNSSIPDAEASIAIYEQISPVITKLKTQQPAAGFATIVDGKYSAGTYTALSEVYEDFYVYQAGVLPDDADTDYTGMIVNPGFEYGNTMGWTYSPSVDHGAKSTSNNTYKMTNSEGDYLFNIWDAGHKISQTVTNLPTGYYKLQAVVSTGSGRVFLIANNNHVGIDCANQTTGYEAELTIKVTGGTMTIGASGCNNDASKTYSDVGVWWYKADNFRLTYLGTTASVTDEQIAALVATMPDAPMSADVKTAMLTAKTNLESSKTVEDYNTLIDAIENAKVSIAVYETLKAAIDKANDLKDANNFVTASGTTTYESVITTTTNGWTNGTYTNAEVTNEIKALGIAVSGWHANATGAAGIYMTSAWGKNSENWWNAPYINTWSIEGDNDGSGFSVPFFEYFADAKDNLPANTFTATLTGLTNGPYEVELWARVQRRTNDDFNPDNSMITMDVNGGDAVSIMSDTEHNVGSGSNVMRLGRYTARGMVTDGTLNLNINVKLGSNVHWLSWRDVTYTKLPVSITISDAGFATLYSAYALDFEHATPAGLTAYTADLDGETVTLTAVNNVPANTGVVLKGDEGAYMIPVIESSSTDPEDLTGNVSASTDYNAFVGEGYYIYGLALNGGQAQFTKVTSGSVAPGKAFLKVSTAVSSKSLRAVVPGQPTEVTAPEVVETEEPEVLFNMAGIPVGKDFKGYVINQKGEKRLQR